LPIVAWTISNPDGATTSNRLQIVEAHGSLYNTNLYTWNVVSNQWQLDTGNGLMRKLMFETWDGMHSNHTETVQVVNPVNGQILSQNVSYYQIVSAISGSGWRNQLVQQVEGFGTTLLTNKYTYYDSGRLFEKIQDDGYYEKYEYDHKNRVTSHTTSLAAHANDSPPWSYAHQIYFNYTPFTSVGMTRVVSPIEHARS